MAAKKKGLTLFDKLVIIVLIMLALYPLDPTDVLDFGTPLIEGLGLVGYCVARAKSWGIKLQ